MGSVLGGQVKQKRNALNAVANAHGHSSRSHLSSMESMEHISLDPEVLEIRQQLEQLQARAAVVEKQSTDETPMTGNPKADALKLTLENLPKYDSYDDVRAFLVDKSTGML